LFDAGIDRPGVALVELHGVALPAGLANRRQRRIGPPCVAYIGDDDIGAGAGKCLRNRLADVSRPAGNERDLAFAIHDVPPSHTTASTAARQHQVCNMRCRAGARPAYGGGNRRAAMRFQMNSTTIAPRVAAMKPAPWSARYHPTAWPMKVARNAPAMPSAVV